MGMAFEYVFGTEEDREILKTKGIEHSDIVGFHELVREYPDQIIVDRFRVVDKINTAEDSEGNCYDWYEICDHYRDSDKFMGDICKTEQEITDMDIVAMEMGDALTDAEIAIMELEDRINNMEA